MKRHVLATAITIAALAMISFAGSAGADSAISHYSFYGCTGPGVPSAFVAVKTALPETASHGVSAASAFRVVGSSDTYTVYDFGFGTTHGITVSGVAQDQCWVQFAGVTGPTLVGGLYHPGR
jgi:hypothetical protein